VGTCHLDPFTFKDTGSVFAKYYSKKHATSVLEEGMTGSLSFSYL